MHWEEGSALDPERKLLQWRHKGLLMFSDFDRNSLSVITWIMEQKYEYVNASMHQKVFEKHIWSVLSIIGFCCIQLHFQEGTQVKYSKVSSCLWHSISKEKNTGLVFRNWCDNFIFVTFPVTTEKSLKLPMTQFQDIG